MNKQSWEYVSREVDRLYEKQFDPRDIKGIEAHCEFIRSFLHACGWTEQEYFDAYSGFVPLDSGLN